MELGDIIVKIEDKKINNEVDLIDTLESFEPGQRVRVTVSRPDVDVKSGELVMKETVLVTQLKASSDSSASNF